MKKLVLFRLLLISAFLATACGGAAERKTAHIEAGDEYYAQENYEKARLEFKNALRIDPKDESIHFKLGMVYKKLENYKASAGEFLRVLQLDENSIDARVKLGELYLLGRAPELVHRMVDEINNIEPDNNDALFLLAGAELLSGNIESAQVHAEKAFERDQDNQDIASLLAAIHARRSNIPRAIEILEDSLKRHPGSIAIRLALVRLYGRIGNNDAIIKLLHENHALQPEQLGHLIRLTSAYIGSGQHSEAEKILRDATLNQPDNMFIKLVLVDFVMNHHGFEAAELELKSFIGMWPHEQELKFGLAALYENNNFFEKSVDVYKSIIKQSGTSPDGLRARTRLASVFFNRNEPAIALDLLEEVLANNTSDRTALLLRAGHNMRRADYVLAINDLRVALDGNSDDAEILRLLAKAHLANNEVNLAQDNFIKALQANPADIDGRIALAELQTDSGEFIQAEENFRRVLKFSPDHRDAYVGLIKNLIRAGKYEEAGSVLADFKSSHDDAALTYHFSGILHYLEGDYEDSVTALKRVLQLKPNAVEPLAALIKAYMAMQQEDSAIAYLRSHIESQPDSVFAQNLVGELLLKKGNIEEAMPLLQNAIRQQPTFWMPYRNLAIAHIRQKDFKAAVATYKEGIAATSYEEKLVVGLADLYESMGEHEQALKYYQSAIQHGRRTDAIQNNLAMTLVTYKKDDEKSLLQAKKLVEKFRDAENPNYLDTYGWVSLRAGDYQEALSALQLASHRAPDSPLISYHLAEAYYHVDQTDMAVKHLENALVKGADFAGKERAESLLRELKSKHI